MTNSIYPVSENIIQLANNSHLRGKKKEYFLQETNSLFDSFYSLRDRRHFIQNNLEPTLCKICLNPCHYDKTYCSYECSYNDPELQKEKQIKIKQTMMNNYGVDNAFKSKEIQEKIKETMLKNYGVEYVYQSEEIQNKIHQTNFKRYGSETPYESKQVQEKRKENCLRNFGVENFFQTQDVKIKSKETMISKYGVEHPEYIKLIPIWEELNSQDYWNQFTTINEIKIWLKDYLTDSPIYKWINKFRPDLIGQNYPISYPHQIIINWLNEQKIEHENNNRQIIKPKELDIVIEQYNLAIEVNGYFWHTEEKGKGQEYHDNKTRLCLEQGITLLHFWDYEILNTPDEVFSSINKELKLDIQEPSNIESFFS